MSSERSHFRHGATARCAVANGLFKIFVDNDSGLANLLLHLEKVSHALELCRVLANNQLDVGHLGAFASMLVRDLRGLRRMTRLQSAATREEWRACQSCAGGRVRWVEMGWRRWGGGDGGVP